MLIDISPIAAYSSWCSYNCSKSLCLNRHVGSISFFSSMKFIRSRGVAEPRLKLDKQQGIAQREGRKKPMGHERNQEEQKETKGMYRPAPF